MKKLIIVLFISLLTAFLNLTDGQIIDINLLFQKFQNFYAKGDLVNAQKTLFLILESDLSLKEGEKIAVYNNLGVVSLLLGNYSNALKYNSKAEQLISITDHNSKELADIYNNKGHIFNIEKSFDLAIDYLSKSIRIYKYLYARNENVLVSLSSAYLNISVALIETKQY